MTDVRLSQEPSRHSILYLVGVVNSHRRHYKLSCFLYGFFNATVMVFTDSYHLSQSRRDAFKFEIHSNRSKFSNFLLNNQAFLSGMSRFLPSYFHRIRTWTKLTLWKFLSDRVVHNKTHDTT
jgi:hypothetical protein